MSDDNQGLPCQVTDIHVLAGGFREKKWPSSQPKQKNDFDWAWSKPYKVTWIQDGHVTSYFFLSTPK